MRIIILCLVFLTVSGLYNHLSAQDQSSEQGYKLAVGIRFSTAAPTLNNSLSVKYFIDESNAIEGLVSFGSRLGIGGLYEKHQLIGATPASPGSTAAAPTSGSRAAGPGLGQQEW